MLDIGSDELIERDRLLQPLRRWLAVDGETPVGLATAFLRPDDRLFVSHRLSTEAAFGPLLDAAVDELDQPIHLSIANGQDNRLRLAERAGFVSELHALAFEVPFRSALRRTAGQWSNRIEPVPADEVRPDHLFTLDVQLRQDVPGISGWRGNRAWFDDEMAADDFDPSGYLVARDRSSGDLVGLCRFWRNPEGPALGMLAMRPSHRSGRPTLGLLHASMLAASRWGFDSFSTHTAHTSLQRRLRAIGATETGGSQQLRRAV